MIDLFQLSDLKINIGLPFFHDNDLILVLMVYKFMLKILHAGGFIKASYQPLVAHQNKLSMLRWFIGLDLYERSLLPVEQPAFTVDSPYIGRNQAAAGAQYVWRVLFI